MNTARVVVGLGANLGDRLATMRSAVVCVERLRDVDVLACSRVYETAPVGGPSQASYLNAAVLLACRLEPRVLLRELLSIERELGRVRAERFGPRTIDLDVLWIDGVVLSDAELAVPHPRLHERAFALVPMIELAPDARDPRTQLPFVVTEAAGEVSLTDHTLSPASKPYRAPEVRPARSK